MKRSFRSPARWWSQIVLAFIVGLCGATAVHAGFTMEMDLVLEYNQYSFFPNLGTNGTPPTLPFGDYFVTSPGWPTNGSSALYQLDTNGFNQIGGGHYGFNVFDAPDFSDSFVQNITNGKWSIFVTNAAVTDVYYFNVTVNIDSNSLREEFD